MFQRLISDKRLRYLLVGSSSALLEYLSFLLLNFLIGNVLLANALSFLIGFLYSFTLHKQWAFKGEHRHGYWSQIIAYGSLAAINLMISTAVIGWLVHQLGLPAFIAKVICMALIVVWNFAVLNRIIFKPNTPKS